MPKSVFGKALVLLIVGLSPLIIGIILLIVLQNENLETFIMTACTLAGGLLDVFILKREYGKEAKKSILKPNVRLLFYIILFAIGYSVLSASSFKKDMFAEIYGYNDFLSVYDWIGFAIFAPIGEELIYRYSIFSTICDGDKRLKLVIATIVSSLIFMTLHFDGDLSRNIDLFVFGCISASILHISKNLIYSICFHIISNITTYSMATVFQIVQFNVGIIWIGILMLLTSVIMIILYYRKEMTFAKKLV